MTGVKYEKNKAAQDTIRRAEDFDDPTKAESQ